MNGAANANRLSKRGAIANEGSSRGEIVNRVSFAKPSTPSSPHASTLTSASSQQLLLSSKEIAAAAAVVNRAAALQQAVATLEDKCQRSEVALLSAKTHSDHLEKQLEEEKRRVSELARQNVDLKTQLEARDERNEELTSRLATLESGLHQLVGQVPPTVIQIARSQEGSDDTEDSDGDDDGEEKKSEKASGDDEEKEEKEESDSHGSEEADEEEEPSEQRSKTDESMGDNEEEEGQDEDKFPFGKVAALGHDDDYDKDAAPEWASSVGDRYVAVFAPHHSIFENTEPLPAKRKRKSIHDNLKM